MKIFIKDFLISLNFIKTKKHIHRTSARTAYLINKVGVRKLVLARLERFNAVYGFAYHRVSIKDQRTMWGSCSRKGNLNFNWRVIQLPPALADYVIVHELCHLQELNHSRRFWDLVARTIPDYKERRKALRAYSLR